MNRAGVPTPSPSIVGVSDLDLAIVGNCSYGALIDKLGTVKWCCLPRFDGDPVFCSLLRRTNDIGFYEISLENYSHSKQYYVRNTGVLKTELYSKNGDALEITDFAPRFMMFGRAYRPIMLIRIVKPLAGHPRIRVRIRPTFGYGWGSPEKTRGTNHIRYLLPNFAVRVTTNAPISYIVDEVLFEVTEPTSFVLMPDESLKESLTEITSSYLDKTIDYWLEFSRVLSIPFEWQEQVLRSCITLKMCSYEETGAMIAALTSSVPVDPKSQGYDLRFCWVRDSSNIIHTLNKLGSTKTMEEFLKYISNIVGSSDSKDHLQPVYGIALETALYEKEMHRLAGYRGLGPVRVGNKDYKAIQNDVYGHLILASTQMFFDQRLKNMGDHLLFERLEEIGERALQVYDQPDSGPLGLEQEVNEIHTFSAAMCWAAADRLRKISLIIKRDERAQYWLKAADKIKATILERAWSDELKSFTSTWGGKKVDAFLLTLLPIGFIHASDERFVSTLARVEKDLKRGNYICSDSPTHGNITQTFWYIDALTAVGRRDEARELFEVMLKTANSSGLLSERVDIHTGELWGNFPKTTAMVGLIECALKLSKEWDEVI
jgi:GH15 family glucan-1,4-alpha-glucosidase